MEASKEADEFANYAFHQGSHPKYTLLIEEKITEIERRCIKGSLTEEKAYQKILDITNSAKNAIKNGKGKIMNDIKF